MTKNVWQRDLFTVTKGDIEVQIGDKIEYDPHVNSYKGEWKVLGAEDGNLLIMSTEDIGTLKLHGLRGDKSTNYGLFNGISRLNEMCEPFGKGKGALYSRSIKVEDVNKIVLFDPYRHFHRYMIDDFANKVKYIWSRGDEMLYIELRSSLDKAMYVLSERFIYVDLETMTKKTLNFGEEIPRIRSSYYAYNIRDERYVGYYSEKGIEMLVENEASYWTASSYTCTSVCYPMYGLRRVDKEHLIGEYLFFSNDTEFSECAGVRAVVALSPDIILKPNGMGSYTIK